MPPSSTDLLAAIHDLGERLCAALRQNRLESAAALVQERDLLIQRLEAFNHPSEIDVAWKQWRSKFTAQHEALTRALTALDAQVTDTRRQIEVLSRAHETYGATHASPSGVLHPNFSA